MSYSLFLFHPDNRVQGTGVLCVEKVDLIACDSRKRAPILQEKLGSN